MREIVKQAKKQCMQLLTTSRCRLLPFHNEKHTLEVFEHVEKIGRFEHITDDEMELVMLAALFHDTGNAKIFYGHENFSLTEASLFLQKRNYPVDRIGRVMDCICATRMPQNPTTKIESILCDADLYHLGAKSFLKKSNFLRKEWSDYQNLEYTDENWLTMNIEFLRGHTFHTAYGKTILEPMKQENITSLKNELKQMNEL